MIVLILAAPLFADVTADGGLARGPVYVRTDGRMGFGPRGTSVVDSKEGLERLTDIIEGLKRKKQLVEIFFEKDANATVTGKVLEQIRAATPVLDVPSSEWQEQAVILKTAEFKLTFVVDSKDALSGQQNAKAVMAEVLSRRRALIQANQQAARNGEDTVKYQEAMTSMTTVYRDVVQKIRLKR